MSPLRGVEHRLGCARDSVLSLCVWVDLLSALSKAGASLRSSAGSARIAAASRRSSNGDVPDRSQRLAAGRGLRTRAAYSASPTGVIDHAIARRPAFLGLPARTSSDSMSASARRPERDRSTCPQPPRALLTPGVGRRLRIAQGPSGRTSRTARRPAHRQMTLAPFRSC